MAGGSKVPRWQDKQLRRLEGLVYNRDFQNDLNQIDISVGFEPLYRFAEKYKVQPTLILEYLKNRRIPPSAVIPTMSIICDEDETAGPADSLEEAQYNYIAMRKFPHSGVHLYIPPGSDQAEIASFIKDHWPYIEGKIGKAKKIRRSPAAERDAEVIRLRESGMKHAAIADVINKDKRFEKLRPITYVDIPRIVKRKS